jgi:transcriptional regulator with XRE-family HTH domain
MNSIGKKISERRKLKGYTQEDLAEFSKINLRTIQRIENDKNEPRGKTLNLICDVLEIDINEFKKIEVDSNNRNIFDITINLVFYILLNLILMFMIGYLSLQVLYVLDILHLLFVIYTYEFNEFNETQNEHVH